MPRRQNKRGSSGWLVAPGVATVLAFLVLPLALVLDQSLRAFTPGLVGAATDAPYTLVNYRDALSASYVPYFVETFRLSVLAAAVGLGLAAPLAYVIAHTRHARLRRSWVMLLTALLFLSILIRTYAILLGLGPAGFGGDLSRLLGMGMNSRAYIRLSVVVGLASCLIPMLALLLVAPLRMLDARLVDAAQSLGASRAKGHLTVTLPLARNALIAAFFIGFNFCISAFVIPTILGKGRISFVSNLVYTRFGEIGNYPSGGAFAILLLALSVLGVSGLSAALQRRAQP